MGSVYSFLLDGCEYEKMKLLAIQIVFAIKCGRLGIERRKQIEQAAILS